MTPTLHKSIIKTQLNTTLMIEQTKSLHHHQILSDSSDSSNCMSSKLTKRCTNLVSVASLWMHKTIFSLWTL